MNDQFIDSLRITKLTERVKNLEDKVFKKSKKTETTRARQILLLKHTGIFELLNSFETTKEKKAIFLSVLLNRSAENFEDDLTNIFSDESPIATVGNYQFLVETFDKLGLSHAKTQCEKILLKLINQG